MSDTVDRAEALIIYADGLEQAGMIDYARRARDVARDTIELAQQLEAERSSTAALKQRCDELQAIVGKAAYQALGVPDTTFDDIPF